MAHMSQPHGGIFPADSRTKMSESYFSAEYLHNISTDTHINHSVILARRADKNPAGAFHLDSLFDKDALVALKKYKNLKL